MCLAKSAWCSSDAVQDRVELRTLYQIPLRESGLLYPELKVGRTAFNRDKKMLSCVAMRQERALKASFYAKMSLIYCYVEIKYCPVRQKQCAVLA